ncbi:MAG: electron transfer flavoprotein subunit alpha/FixB family protein [Hyphomicrobiales bacterium]
MAVLLVADHDNKTLNPATAKTMSAAKALGGDVHILVAGSGCEAVAKEAATLDGAAKVLLADAPHLASQLAEEMAALVVSLADGYDAVVAPATTTGKNWMPRAAALLDVAQISEITAVKSPDTFERPIYAGNAIQTVQSTDGKKLITVRATAFPAVAAGGGAPIENAPVPAPVGISSFASAALTPSDRPELTSARIIVSGGRGLGSSENFAKYVEPVAETLGAAVGASRAAVDAGYVSNDHQVGQTGKVVAPELYVAVGISGAIQHLAGMKDSKVIVAINKDEEAPIFQVADYGLVADLFTALPALDEALKKARSS